METAANPSAEAPHPATADAPLLIVGKPHAALEESITRARDALLALQHPEGYWCFELEADCTIPAEYVLMMHYMDEVDDDLQEKLARYLRARRTAGGGWPLYHDGPFDLSATVKAYYALKLCGDDPDAPHMRRARDAVLAHGGAARANVFTRITLALFRQIPWRGVPFLPVEIMLLPRWFPFHLSKVSYWSRTVMVPLLILCSRKARAHNPTGRGVRELFTVPPEHEKHYFPVRSPLNRVLLILERLGRRLEPLIPRALRARALRRAEQWMVERLNGTHGLGAIFPAMVNAYQALGLLGYPPEHPFRRSAREALQRLLIVRDDEAYCQPCLSPVWDTALACLTLQELGDEPSRDAVRRALDWLRERQLKDAPGDWREARPELPGGGWPFQFQNSHYPDLDDTSAVAWSMDRAGDERYREAIDRAAQWVQGMQCANGGFASFDADNTRYYLNEIPFADHGALLDPPTADVSARALSLLSRTSRRDGRYRNAVQACLGDLRREQEPAGPWFGRWGTNYIYGTWSVLMALEQAGVGAQDPMVRRAVAWLRDHQRPDGSWGESNDSYFDPNCAGRNRTGTSYQTAWALLGLFAGGETDTPAVRRGIHYLLAAQQPDDLWHDSDFTCPGFPRVFYLKYHGYDKYFPLWALARFRDILYRSVV